MFKGQNVFSTAMSCLHILPLKFKKVNFPSGQNFKNALTADIICAKVISLSLYANGP